MAALTKDRKTVTAFRGVRAFPVLASTVIYEGSIVAVDASGWARPARSVASNTDRIVGRAELRADNSVGANGAVYVSVRCDDVCFYVNGDSITSADVGKDCYASDDQTIVKTSAATVARAGKVYTVDATYGVGVVFDA